MASIADIFASVRLNLETGEFEAQAQKAGDRAGQSFGSKLKAAAGGAIGAALGAGLGMALTGANQLDAATRQLAADAGLTAEEAGKAQHAMAGMYRNNLQGFDAIGAAMAKVHNDLGLVGKDADAMTAKFLKFSTATGQDAAGAVAAFDDILDAWNLTAADAGGLMDKLIVSHQKFGGVISESQSALAEMAPAMQAANMTVDDGIALLNLFATAGIDASKAPTMLAKAVKQLKPGQDINDLIAQIGAIEDPTLRAQKAMEIFGAKTGIGMAQAIKPGMTSLDELKASLGDTAGATEGAAAVIEESWGNRFQLLMKNAGGALAEFGTKFGPLLMVASAFGPQLTKAIGAGLGGLTGILIPKVVGGVAATAVPGAVAGTGVGATIGAAIGAAIPIAIAAGLGLGIALVFKKVFLDPGLEKQAKEIGAAVGKQVVSGTLDQLEQSKAALEQGIADLNALPFGGFLAGDQISSLQRDLDAVDAEILRRATATGASLPVALADGAASTKPVWDGEIATLVATFTTSMSGVVQASRVTGADGMAAMAAGIGAARKKPLDAFDTLTEMLKHAMSPSAEAARLAGQLTSKELAAGLKSADPEVRAQALAVKQSILDRLTELGASRNIGENAMKALEAGLKSKDPEIRAAAQAAKATVEEGLGAIKAKEAAETAAAEYAAYWAGPEGKAKILGAIGSITSSVQGLLGGLGIGSGGSSTPRGVQKFAMGTPFVERDQLAFIHRGEAIIPAARNNPGAIGGQTVNVVINNPKPEPASTSVSRALQHLAFLGSTG
jgi:hypothetical protein